MLINKNCLFISYDGLSDPLGQSQILPYILSLSKNSKKIHIISFEKKNRLRKYQKIIENKFKNTSIKWHRYSFTSKFGKLGKLYDLLKIILMTIYVILRFKIKIIHGRGLIPSFIGLIFKKLFFFQKINLLFDCRGLWADERIDNGILKIDKFIDKMIYKILKIIERFCLLNSNHIVFLTQKVKTELENLYKVEFINSTIIPCCVDFNKFDFRKKDYFKKIFKANYNIPENSIVFNYNGSLTGVYLLEEMLSFFYKIKDKIPNAYFVITSPDINPASKIIDLKYKNLKKSIIISEVSHSEIPNYLSISDFSIAFIKETYARCAMSPTKLAESLALGVPVIYNDNIGDVTSIISKLNAGIVIDYNNSSEIQSFINNYKKICNFRGENLVHMSKKLFDISIANKKYLDIYKKLETN